MKAIVVHEFGAPEVMKLEEFPTPKAGPGQAVVRIHAAGVNPFDTYMRAGTYAIKPPLPYVPGGEGAGVVHSVGEGVTKFKPGDRVYVGHPVTGHVRGILAGARIAAAPAARSHNFQSGRGNLRGVRHGLSRALPSRERARLGNAAGARRKRRRGNRRGANGARDGHDGDRHGGHGQGP